MKSDFETSEKRHLSTDSQPDMLPDYSGGMSEAERALLHGHVDGEVGGEGDGQLRGEGDGQLRDERGDATGGLRDELGAGQLGAHVRAALAWHESPKRSQGWDLHTHTVFSDGQCTPSEAIELAKNAGIAGIALTDHDSAQGWSEAEKRARELNMPLIRGTEITAEWGHTSVHMLAWLYDPTNEALAELFRTTRINRVRRTKKMVEMMGKKYPITWEDVLKQAGGTAQTTIGRPHIADTLVAKGLFATRSEAFLGPVSSKSEFYLPVISPQVDEVITTVKDAGGVVAIAHAGSFARNKEILSDQDIRHFADLGLDALEVWHRENSPEQRVRLLKLASRLGLLATGGSDWHGPHGKPNLLGENLTDPQTLQAIVTRGVLPVVE